MSDNEKVGWIVERLTRPSTTLMIAFAFLAAHTSMVWAALVEMGYPWHESVRAPGLSWDDLVLIGVLVALGHAVSFVLLRRDERKLRALVRLERIFGEALGYRVRPSQEVMVINERALRERQRACVGRRMAWGVVFSMVPVFVGLNKMYVTYDPTTRPHPIDFLGPCALSALAVLTHLPWNYRAPPMN